ncbi:MAG: GNAT family N-acetyltransferase [Alphaproteobacteria bacterium]|nr:GNAT family N-acetyltransferase [Alphaproteobacteria bacterium]
MSTENLLITPPAPADQDDWARLYRGYADFYRVPMTDEILATVWGWIHDAAHEVDALVARRGGGGSLVGLAHFRPFARPLRGTVGLFLDDLFVAPEERGGRIGRGLIEAVAGEARTRGFGVVRWITADDNYRARTLYDRLAARTMWVTYDLDTGAITEAG